MNTMPPDDAYSDLAQLTGRLIHDIKNHVSTLGLNLQLLAEDLHEPELWGCASSGGKRL